MPASFIVRGRLDAYMKHQLTTRNIDKTEESDDDFIRSIRMQPQFVQRLDRFVRLILQSLFSEYYIENGDESDQELTEDHIASAATRMIEKFQLELHVTNLSNLRVLLVRINEYIMDEHYPKVKLPTCKSIRNATLHKISLDVIIPIIEICLKQCIDMCLVNNRRKTERKDISYNEHNGDIEQKADTEQKGYSEYNRKKKRRFRPYQCVHLTTDILYTVADTIIPGMYSLLRVCQEHCTEKFTDVVIEDPEEEHEIEVGEGGALESGEGGALESGEGGALESGEGGALESGEGGALESGEGGAIESGEGGALESGEGGALASGEGAIESGVD
jgi:hypothetical protein